MENNQDKTTSKEEEYGGLHEGSELRVNGRILNRNKQDLFSYYFVRSGRDYIKTKVDNSIFPEFRKGDLISFIGTVKKQPLSGDPYLNVEKVVDHKSCEGMLPNQQYFDKEQEDATVQAMFDPATFEFFKKTSDFYRSTRNFLDDRGFMEVITPSLISKTYPSKAKEFQIREKDLFLRKIQEPKLKPYLIAGYNRVYELGKVFRNEGVGSRFLNEFTNLDILMSYVDLEGLMDLSKEFFIQSSKVFGVDIKEIPIRNIGEFGIPGSLEEVARIFKKEVATKIPGTFIVQGYPSSLAPTAKSNEDGTSQEFRVFHNGYSFMHGYMFKEDKDLIVAQDAQEKQRQDLEGKLWKGLDKLAPYGMPPSGGVGVGIEALIKLVANKNSIKKVLFYKP